MTSNRGRTAAVVLLVFMVLILLILLILPLVPLPPLRRMAEDELRLQTGRNVEIGSATVSFAGGPGIRLSDVSVASGEAETLGRLLFGGDQEGRNFFSAEQVRIRLDLSALAKFQMQPKTITIERPVIHAGRTASQVLSFREIIDWIAGLDEEAGEYRLPPIERFLVLDGKVEVLDQGGLVPEALKIDVSDLRFEAVDLIPGRTSRFALEGRVFDGSPGSLSGGGTFGPIDERVAMTETPLRGQIVMREVPRWLALALAMEWPGESAAIVIDFSGTISELSTNYSLAQTDADARKIICSKTFRAADTYIWPHATEGFKLGQHRQESRGQAKGLHFTQEWQRLRFHVPRGP